MTTKRDRDRPPIRVLHVEDESDFAEVFAELLEREDERISVHTATGSADGWDRITADAVGFDCIVSEYELEGQNGIEFLETVREEYPDMPFILFTGKGSEEVASSAISAGVTDYVQKISGADQCTNLADRIRNAIDRTWVHHRHELSTRRFEAVFEDPQMLVGILNPDGTLLKANHKAMEYVEADGEAVVGDPFWETPWWPDEIQAEVRDWVERSASGEYVTYEADLTSPDGELYNVEGTVRPVSNAADSVVSIIVSARDVTERKDRKRMLQRYETVVDEMNEAVVMLDSKGRYVFVNDNAAGPKPPDWWLGRTPDALRQIGSLDEEQVRKHESAIDRLLAGESEQEKQTFTITSADGEEIILDTRWTAVTGDAGEVIGVVGTHRDVTIERKQQQLLERQNARLQEFADVVSHDIRNPLNIAHGRVKMALQSGEADHLDEADTALGRCHHLIDDLLELARQGDRIGTVRPVELAEVTEKSWQVRSTSLATLCVETALTVTADRSRLRQLLENLVQNAIEHGDDATTVTVGDIDGGFYVADDGPGIPEDRRKEVFAARHSTKEDGTGLGLKIVEQIADAHGWNVTVTESDDGGARFEFSNVEIGR